MLYGFRYAWARESGHLGAMVEYAAGARAVIGDLVQLLHKQRDPMRAPPLRLPQIKNIHFTSPSEIPSLLTTPFVMARPELGAGPLVSNPRARDVSQTERAGDEEKVQQEEPEAEPVHEVHEELVDEAREKPELHELVPASDEPTLMCEHEPAEREVSAAEKIQVAYRFYRKRRATRARAIGGGLKAQRNTIFMACLKNVLDSKWGKTPYRTLYLWALPRLLVCIDRAIAIAHEIKGKTKNLLLKESHERLEELANQTTMMK